MKLLLMDSTILLLLWLLLLAGQAAMRCRDNAGVLVLAVMPGWACVEVAK